MVISIGAENKHIFLHFIEIEIRTINIKLIVIN
jgi:hypothetical protein